jgi:hypothetical protein
VNEQEVSSEINHTHSILVFHTYQFIHMVKSAPLKRRERTGFDCSFQKEVHEIQETGVRCVEIAHCNIIALRRPIDGVIRGCVHFLEEKHMSSERWT